MDLLERDRRKVRVPSSTLSIGSLPNEGVIQEMFPLLSRIECLSQQSVLCVISTVMFSLFHVATFNENDALCSHPRRSGLVL